MLYQNTELTPNIFVDDDRTYLRSWQDFRGYKLNRDIYFSPTNNPRMIRQDVRKGSCFDGWYVPTPSELFEAQQGKIVSAKLLPQTLRLEDYKKQITFIIEKNITEVFDTNPVVNLAFSGSMDSMILLAFIVRMGLEKRTRLVSFNNQITYKSDALCYDQSRQDQINNFFDTWGARFHDVSWEVMRFEDLIELINLGVDPDRLLPYTLSIAARHRPGQTWIGGYHGNRTILHQRIFLDQLRLWDPSITQKLKKQVEESWDKVYSHSIRKINLDNDPVHIAYQSQSNKPWDSVSGFYDSKIYLPLGTEDMFCLLRQIHPGDFDFDLVAKVTFGIELIQQNAPELLEWMTQRQSENDLDGVESWMLPFDRIDLSKFKVPTDLEHNKEGSDWIEYAMEQGRTSGEIEFNTLVSIKNLQYIHRKINNF